MKQEFRLLENISSDINILKDDMVIKPFESIDEDLNSFLRDDAKNYLSSMLAITYLIQSETETIAYFCLANDRITMDEDEKSVWNKINRLIVNKKRRKSYPAVKIGRLAVSKNYARMGIGDHRIRVVRIMYTGKQQQAGCRFITVDAYAAAIPFYEKCGFHFLTDKDKSNPTRAMYFDLKATE